MATSSPSTRAAGLLALLLAAAAVRGQADEWKYDVVVLKAGQKTLKGILIDYKENAPFLDLRVVVRKPGERTRLERHFLDRRDVDRVEPLSANDRTLLESRLRALDLTGKELAERIRALELERVAWSPGGPKTAYRYEGSHFVLTANVNEDLFRPLAVRLAQVYAAYERLLPARHHAARPTAILLAGTLADYQALLRARGHAFVNPAFYDPMKNEIVCGCDLDRLGAQREAVRREHARAEEGLKAREAELKRVYKNKVPPELLRPIAQARAQIQATDKANDKQFEEATRLLFQRLGHEAFHAYLGSFVYPGDRDEVPRWLNEGLAQVFETALFEGDECRIGHADPERLRRAQAAATRDELVPLTELLRSGPKQFVVAHAGDKQLSDRFYLTSWALAMYLTFEQKVLGTQALDDYARATWNKADPVEAFCALLGMDAARLAQAERAFRSYVQRLRPDGSVRRGRD